MRIVFAYKGRYHVRDASTVEILSAIAALHQHETLLLYDQDVFGVTDNVFSNTTLNKFLSNDDVTVRHLLAKSPDAVIFLDQCNRRRWNETIASKLKNIRKDTVTVALVPWEGLPVSRTAFDYILIGEPEHTFEKFLSERIYDKDKGVFRLDGLADLDRLPLPDKRLFAPYINFRDSYLIYTSRGCPYHCSYCEETIYRKKFGDAFFRRRSPENVISELAAAKKDFDAREVIYKDSVFAWDKRWLKEYLKLYKEKIGLAYKCFGKAEVFDDEIAALLKDTGCYCVEFGVQTFNEKLKRGYLQRSERTEVLLDAFSRCQRFSLRYDVDHLFGIPGERLEDHVESTKIYVGLQGLNRIKCHNLVYYREADIYEFAPGRIKDDRTYDADFFSSISGDSAMLELNRLFEKYFKVLPLLPKRINLFILKRSGWNAFRFVPGLIVIMLMSLLALKNADTRFWVYGMYYPKKILNSLLKK